MLVAMLRTLLDGLGDLVFPYNCILCSRYVTDPDKSRPQLCPQCLAAIEFNGPPFCLRCSRRLEIYSPEGLCLTCLKYPAVFDSAWGAVVYTPPVQKLLHLFKYHQRTGVRKIFRHFLEEFFDRYPTSFNTFDYLMPMPLHPVRLRERGFNQAELLTRIVSEKFDIPILSNVLVRQRLTQPQSFLGQKERWTNLEGAFTIKRPFNINNYSILLVDDLLTTGATASAAAATLKEAGAKTVGLLVVALAP